MKELMLFMGNALPKDFIIEKLEKAIADWKLDASDEKWRKIEMYCHLILSKALAELDGGIENTLTKMDRMDKALKLMNPESQQ